MRVVSEGALDEAMRSTWLIKVIIEKKSMSDYIYTLPFWKDVGLSS
jgi:hypothetical protein